MPTPMPTPQKQKNERMNASIEGGRGEIHQVAEKHTRTHTHTHMHSLTHTQKYCTIKLRAGTPPRISMWRKPEKGRQTKLKTWPVWIVLMNTPMYSIGLCLPPLLIKGMLLKNFCLEFSLSDLKRFDRPFARLARGAANLSVNPIECACVCVSLIKFNLIQLKSHSIQLD